MDRGAAISVYKLFGPNGKRIADSLHLPTYVVQTTIDSLDVPATGIQAIYIPINSSQEIGIVTSQIAYYNLKSQLLGSHDWYSTIELDANKRYADGVIFFPDFYVDTRDSSYNAFAKRWSDTMKRRPSTNAVIGYDALYHVASVVLRGITTRAAIAERLTADTASLLHGELSFNNRVNATLHVLQFKDGDIRKLQNITVH